MKARPGERSFEGKRGAAVMEAVEAKGELNANHRDCVAGQKAAIKHAVQAGLILSQWKARLPHGEYEKSRDFVLIFGACTKYVKIFIFRPYRKNTTECFISKIRYVSVAVYLCNKVKLRSDVSKALYIQR